MEWRNRKVAIMGLVQHSNLISSYNENKSSYNGKRAPGRSNYKHTCRDVQIPGDACPSRSGCQASVDSPLTDACLLSDVCRNGVCHVMCLHHDGNYKYTCYKSHLVGQNHKHTCHKSHQEGMNYKQMSLRRIEQQAHLL